MKRVMVALCAALMLTFVACGGGGDGSADRVDSGNETDNDPGPDDPGPPDSPGVCDPCQVDTLSTGFGECLDNCRVDCPVQFSECRDACLDECDGCGTGLSCLYSGDDTRLYRCGPKSEITTCDGVDYGDGL